MAAWKFREIHENQGIPWILLMRGERLKIASGLGSKKVSETRGPGCSRETIRFRRHAIAR